MLCSRQKLSDFYVVYLIQFVLIILLMRQTLIWFLHILFSCFFILSPSLDFAGSFFLFLLLLLYLCRKSIETANVGREFSVEHQTVRFRSVPNTVHRKKGAGKFYGNNIDKNDENDYGTIVGNKRIKSTTTPSRQASSFFTSKFMLQHTLTQFSFEPSRHFVSFRFDYFGMVCL